MGFLIAGFFFTREKLSVFLWLKEVRLALAAKWDLIKTRLHIILIGDIDDLDERLLYILTVQGTTND